MYRKKRSLHVRQRKHKKNSRLCGFFRTEGDCHQKKDGSLLFVTLRDVKKRRRFPVGRCRCSHFF